MFQVLSLRRCNTEAPSEQGQNIYGTIMDALVQRVHVRGLERHDQTPHYLPQLT